MEDKSLFFQLIEHILAAEASTLIITNYSKMTQVSHDGVHSLTLLAFGNSACLPTGETGTWELIVYCLLLVLISYLHWVSAIG